MCQLAALLPPLAQFSRSRSHTCEDRKATLSCETSLTSPHCPLPRLARHRAAAAHVQKVHSTQGGRGAPAREKPQSPSYCCGLHLIGNLALGRAAQTMQGAQALTWNSLEACGTVPMADASLPPSTEEGYVTHAHPAARQSFSKSRGVTCVVLGGVQYTRSHRLHGSCN